MKQWQTQDFGQGGGQKLSLGKFPDAVKWDLKGQGPGPTLGSWKLLAFSLMNVHSPCFLGTFL